MVPIAPLVSTSVCDRDHRLTPPHGDHCRGGIQAKVRSEP
jgi:hypothetical protein